MRHPIFSTRQTHQLPIAEYRKKLSSQRYKNAISFPFIFFLELAGKWEILNLITTKELLTINDFITPKN